MRSGELGLDTKKGRVFWGVSRSVHSQSTDADSDTFAWHGQPRMRASGYCSAPRNKRAQSTNSIRSPPSLSPDGPMRMGEEMACRESLTDSRTHRTQTQSGKTAELQAVKGGKISSRIFTGQRMCPRYPDWSGKRSPSSKGTERVPNASEYH